MKNVFQQIWNKKHFYNSSSGSFKEIIGHYETKEILNKAIVLKPRSYITGRTSGFGKNNVFARDESSFQINDFCNRQ